MEPWDNNSDYAHDEVCECATCGVEFDAWNQWGIDYNTCPLCRRKARLALIQKHTEPKPSA